MKRKLWRFGFLGLVPALLLVLSGALALAAARDSTSFDPLQVTVKATGSGGVPVGTVVAWPSSSHPKDAENWLECNGQAITQGAYPELYAVVGPNVPDYRGMFLRGYGSQAHTKDNGSTVGVTMTTHSSGALGTVQGDAIRNISGVFRRSWEHSATDGVFYGVEDSPGGDGEYRQGQGVGMVYFDASRMVPTATENRPVNKAVRYLIRARP
ncbi:MAG: phage tail protein [Desulfovibrio sp.]|jgi:hypothetical protein|nr:phage tail protein [Desulfovibrio sp.]